jgi:tetratricopeptide (TPR) repeat protein
LRTAGRTLAAALAACLLSAGWAAAEGGPAIRPGRPACAAESAGDIQVPVGGISLEESILLLSERGCGDVSGRRFDRCALEEALSRLTGRVESILGERRDPRATLDAIGRVLFEEERYAYDASGTDADLYLLDRVVERKRGNCLGLTLLYALIGGRLGVPVTGSYVPGHIFVRYEGDGVRINRETSMKGRELSDAEYRRRFALEPDRPYLKTLDRGELAGILAKTLGASCACGRKDETAIRYYEEASRLYPDLADIYFNTGISLQRTGKPGEAIRQYERSLSIDPGFSAARGNLGHAERQNAASCDFRNPPPGTGGGDGAQRR